MKRLLILLASILVIILPLSADMAYWSGEESGSGAYTDKYSLSSILRIEVGELSSTVTVKGKKGRTLDGRDIALSRETLTSLDLWGKGDEEVTVTLLKGSVVDIENDESEKESGWYEIELERIDGESALESYKALVFNSLKPRVTRDEDTLIFTLPYIAEYEKEETVLLVEKLGLSVKEVRSTLNPYL